MGAELTGKPDIGRWSSIGLAALSFAALVSPWSVDSGTLLANIIGSKDRFYILLATEKEYGDSTSRLRFHVERRVKGDSGIQIRSRSNAETGKLWNEDPGPGTWKTPWRSQCDVGK